MTYPADSAGRDRWIVERRPPRAVLDSLRPYSFGVEDECSSEGDVVGVATVFLTNRECPWKCLMCDLWRNTVEDRVPVGAIPAQIDHALETLGAARQIKLYNSGSFFDRQAIPFEDYEPIARRVNHFERVIVESHPALLGDSCLRFRDLVPGRLEVAMGLETAHPETLSKLNKKMTLEQFSGAAEWLLANDIDLRVFILVKPPYMDEAMALFWAERSLDFAFDCRASVAVLIPTRAGNGALEELAAVGEFSPPKMATVEAAVHYGVGLKRGRVFLDLWDLKRVSECGSCFRERFDRFQQINLQQAMGDPVRCLACRDGE